MITIVGLEELMYFENGTGQFGSVWIIGFGWIFIFSLCTFYTILRIIKLIYINYKGGGQK